MSGLNISLLFAGDNNEVEYISRDQLVNMKEKHASMTKQYMTKQTRWFGTAQVSKKRIIFFT